MKMNWVNSAIVFFAVAIGASPTFGAVSGVFITGHDADNHGNGEYQRAGLDYLSFGHAATGTELAQRALIKVGYLGNTDGSNVGSSALTSGYTNRTFIDLDSPTWHTTAFAPGAFDILMIGSGLDYINSAGSTSLNSQATAFANYFNGGGQIFVHTDQGLGQSFYNFLPTFGATQAAIGSVGDFSVTAAGSLIGLTESIVDRDITHNEYRNVPSIFTVFETHNGSNLPVAIGLRNAVIDDGEFSSLPEPATCAIWSLFAASALGYGSRRRRTV